MSRSGKKVCEEKEEGGVKKRGLSTGTQNTKSANANCEW
jgi:hypothetical protein